MCNKAWIRKLPVPWAAGQRWYCNCCTGCYNTSMGMLPEFHAADALVYWIVSTCPDKLIDAKWMAVEAQYGEARAPQYLYNMIRTTVPHTGDGFVRTAVRADCWGPASLEGVCKVVDIPRMRSMPVWGFMEMVAFAEAI